MINAKHILFTLIIFIGINTPLFSQNGNLNSFRKLSSPEKRWVVFHPFIAKKTLLISNEAKEISKALEKDTILDKDPAGGQVDAFRHCYWMARLSQEIKPKKAFKLGVAHEKGNYIDFKKRIEEDGILPDSVSSVMDLLNNDIGINIGKNNKMLSPTELKLYIIRQIKTGNLFIILKDNSGNFLDYNNDLIKPKELIGRWGNKKYLVRSNL